MEMLEKYKHFFTKLAFKAYCTKPLTYDLVQMHNAICQEVTVQTISTLEEMSYLEYEDRQQLIKVNTSKFKKKHSSENISLCFMKCSRFLKSL